MVRKTIFSIEFFILFLEIVFSFVSRSLSLSQRFDNSRGVWFKLWQLCGTNGYDSILAVSLSPWGRIASKNVIVTITKSLSVFPFSSLNS